MKIWKYEIPASGAGILEIPEGAKLLDVQVQGGVPCVWALVNPAAPAVGREFSTYETGQLLPDDTGDYLATYQIPEEDLVFHVFTT